MRGRNLFVGLTWAVLSACGPSSIDEVGEDEVGETGPGDSTTETGPGDSTTETGPGDSTTETETGPGDSTTETGIGGPPEAPVLELSLSQVKQFDFDWEPAFGAEYFQLLERADEGEPYVQVSGDMVALKTSLTVPLHLRLNASYKLRACNDEGCTESAEVDVVGPLVEAIGYFKASSTGGGDYFGNRVALSGDGNTLAVGAYGEDSDAVGIDGNQANNSAFQAGAVYVYQRDGMDVWTQQAYIKASNSDAYDWFGTAVALSEDGSTLAVGASDEDSIAEGIGGNQADETADGAGAVYVFERDEMNVWTQQAYVKASNTSTLSLFEEDVALFGRSLALSADGNTLAVGAPGEDSNAVGIDGNQADNSAYSSGAVYVYERDGMNVWAQQVYVKASNTGAIDRFGQSVALSGDGSTLVVGAEGEDSNAVGIGGNQADNSAQNAGAVYVYERDGMSVWTQQAYVKASNTGANDRFGASVAMSGDGSILAVGATNAGVVYVYERDAMFVWTQQAEVKASNSGGDRFGTSVALSGDGSTLAVGASREASSAVGLGGNQADNSDFGAGAVYVYERDGMNVWTQQAYVKASNAEADDYFGTSVALSGDGSTLAVGADEEDSDADGIGGNQADNFMQLNAGAVYLY